MRIINGFVWLIVTDKAKILCVQDSFELFVLHDDGTESLVTSFLDIVEALNNGLDIAIEVGDLNK